VATEAKQVSEFSSAERNEYFIHFHSDVSHVDLPKQFTFPFYYTPHPLALQAIEELKPIISDISPELYNFGLDSGIPGGMGKMFGVLVVQKPNGSLGYLAAFSGKLGALSHQKPFVPPVFNRLSDSGYFKQIEAQINAMSARIELLEASPALAEAKQQLKHEQDHYEQQLAEAKQQLKQLKQDRKLQRAEASEEMEPAAFEVLKEQLAKESIKQQLWLKWKQGEWMKVVDEKTSALQALQEEIDTLKEKRKLTSAALQSWLFDQYQFHNANHEIKALQHIFEDFGSTIPRAGAGECAAPKLLQFAYLSGWQPVCMAEFWWGKSPNTEIRKHLNFYPACRSKCEPILGFMLQGLTVEPNPIITADSQHLPLEIIHEDESIVVVNKPSGLLSVPGKQLMDSVAERVRHLFPEVTGPLIVHRLDMSTSGIMVLAKNQQAHKFLQHQFIERTIQKRYVAVLAGELTQKEGSISLPLRVDLDNRPMQMVCFDYGKPATTRWQLIEVKDGQSRVYFYPVTGRTHQLRMHAAHPNGLNMPIIGDDLYGTKGPRLHLHAEQLTFKHPASKTEITFQIDPDF